MSRPAVRLVDDVILVPGRGWIDVKTGKLHLVDDWINTAANDCHDMEAERRALATLDARAAGEPDGDHAARRLQRLERIGDAIESCIPAAAVLIAGLLLWAVVMP